MAQVEANLGSLRRHPTIFFSLPPFTEGSVRPSLTIQGRGEMACRLGSCEINSNRTKAKKVEAKKKKKKKKMVSDSSSEWSESDDSCSGCSACDGSSSSCSCSECNMETGSSDGDCYGYGCRPKARKSAAKKSSKSKKVLQCRDGVCEWVTKKKPKKPTKKKKAPTKTRKAKKC